MILSKETLVVWIGLAVVAMVIVGLVGGKINSWAVIDEPQAAVSVVPIQLGRESYGVVMIDAKSETIWVYEINTRGTTYSRLKLLAARSWHYDKMLEEYNSTEPRPRQVKKIIEQLLKASNSEQVFDGNSPDITTFAEPNKLK
jgi:hypothetical protein